MASTLTREEYSKYKNHYIENGTTHKCILPYLQIEPTLIDYFPIVEDVYFKANVQETNGKYLITYTCHEKKQCGVCKLVIKENGIHELGPKCSECNKQDFGRSCMKGVLPQSLGEHIRRPMCLLCVEKIRKRISRTTLNSDNMETRVLKNNEPKNDDAKNNEASECIICLDKPKTTVFMPCKHQCCCSNCSREVFNTGKMCPFCRTHVSDVIDVYIV